MMENIQKEKDGGKKERDYFNNKNYENYALSSDIN